MDDTFKIFVDQLKKGGVEKIDLTCAPTILEVNEEALRFNYPVCVRGEAYLADDALVLHFNASTVALIPCSICNGPVETAIEVNGFYHMVPLEEIKHGCYSFHGVLRETILLEVPSFAECTNGRCPQRKELAKYLKSPTRADSDGHQPFADINLDQFKP
ncbi:MAG: YceD family protein [Parachlamydiaceae bacterium]